MAHVIFQITPLCFDSFIFLAKLCLADLIVANIIRLICPTQDCLTRQINLDSNIRITIQPFFDRLLSQKLLDNQIFSQSISHFG